MNLWFRLLVYLMLARWRPAIDLPGEASVMHFRVWPSDLDPSMHVNNGKYLSLMDQGRLDLMIAAGLWRPVLKHRWTPIASNVLIRYRRELRLFQKFRLETRLVTWNETHVVMEQIFFLESGSRAGQVAARALFKGGIYDRAARSFVPISRLMQEIGAYAEPPPATPEVAVFLSAEEELRGRAG